MRNIYLAVSVVIPVILGCNLLSGGLPTGGDVQGTPGRETPAPDQSGEGGGFGSVIFSQDVTDSGEIIGASYTFPEGTQQVWAYFDYWGMQPGQSWGRLWTLDGNEYIDVTGEVWEDYESGWVAYSIGGDYDLPPGEYTLRLFIDGVHVQEATFYIMGSGGEVPEGFFRKKHIHSVLNIKPPLRRLIQEPRVMHQHLPGCCSLEKIPG